MRILSSLICFVCLAISVSAQDTHYWTQQFGSRTALLGGAVVGGATSDNTAVWYNPAVLGFIDTGSISVNATAYQIQNYKIKNALGQQADFKSFRLGSIPLLVSGMFPVKNKKLKIGYGIVQPVNFEFKALARLDGKYAVVSDAESPGDEELVAQKSINSDVHEITVALGGGYALDEHWSVGLTNLFTSRSQSYVQATIVRMFLNTPDTALVSGDLVQSFNYYHIRYAARLALAYRNGPVSAGLTFTTPGLKIMGTGTVGVDLTGTNVRINSVRQNIVANGLQPKLKSVFHSPFSVAGGLNLTMKKSMLGVTVQYYGSTDVYDVLRADAGPLVRPVSQSAAYGADDYMRVKGGAHGVVNLAIGYEYQLSKTFTLQGSIRTDMTYYKTGILSYPGIKPDLATYNIYHFAGGGTFRRERSSLTLGLLISSGSDPNHQEMGAVIKPSEDNFLLGSFTVASSSYTSFGLVIGYTYNFRQK